MGRAQSRQAYSRERGKMMVAGLYRTDKCEDCGKVRCVCTKGEVMTTKQKLLQAQGDEFSRLLGEILHGWQCVACGDNNQNYSIEHCKIFKGGLCGNKRPIPLDDWNVAMKWRDWAVGEFGSDAFRDALCVVVESRFGNRVFQDGASIWAVVYATPITYLISAAMCKLKTREV